MATKKEVLNVLKEFAQDHEWADLENLHLDDEVPYSKAIRMVIDCANPPEDIANGILFPDDQGMAKGDLLIGYVVSVVGVTTSLDNGLSAQLWANTQGKDEGSSLSDVIDLGEADSGSIFGLISPCASGNNIIQYYSEDALPVFAIYDGEGSVGDDPHLTGGKIIIFMWAITNTGLTVPD